MELLNKEQIKDLQRTLQDELTKRGFHTKVTLSLRQGSETTGGIEIESEPFQTTPVVFKTCRIIPFANFIGKQENYTRITFDVNFHYEQFDRGSNSVKLFNIIAEAYEDSNSINLISII